MSSPPELSVVIPAYEEEDRIAETVAALRSELGPIDAKMMSPIHRPAPTFEEQSPVQELFETGIKVIDLLTPFVRGGNSVGNRRGCQVDFTVLLTVFRGEDEYLSGAAALEVLPGILRVDYLGGAAHDDVISGRDDCPRDERDRDTPY